MYPTFRTHLILSLAGKNEIRMKIQYDPKFAGIWNFGACRYRCFNVLCRQVYTGNTDDYAHSALSDHWRHCFYGFRWRHPLCGVNGGIHTKSGYDRHPTDRPNPLGAKVLA